MNPTEIFTGFFLLIVFFGGSVWWGGIVCGFFILFCLFCWCFVFKKRQKHLKCLKPFLLFFFGLKIGKPFSLWLKGKINITRKKHIQDQVFSCLWLHSSLNKAIQIKVKAWHCIFTVKTLFRLFYLASAKIKFEYIIFCIRKNVSTPTTYKNAICKEPRTPASGL